MVSSLQIDTKSETADRIAFPKFQLMYISMLRCELKQFPDTKSEGTADFAHSAVLADAHHLRGMKDRVDSTVAFCDFSARKLYGESVSVEITASYVFLYADPPPPLQGQWSTNDILDMVVSNAIWPRFCDLAGVIGSQSAAGFPGLPPIPNEVTHSKGQTDNT